MTHEDHKKFVTDLVDKCAMQIGEHVDSVQIFVTKQSEDGSNTTIFYEKGQGNFYSRFAQAFEFVEIQRQYMRNYAIRKDQQKDEKD